MITERTLPRITSIKYSGPILLSQFSLRFKLRHNFFIDFSFTVAHGAIKIDHPVFVAASANVTITVATWTDPFHYDRTKLSLVKGAAFAKNTARANPRGVALRMFFVLTDLPPVKP